MRIKNLTSNACNQTIIALSALFLLFATIDILIFAIGLNAGMTVWETLCWMFSGFGENNLGYQVAWIALYLLTFLWLILLITQLNVRRYDDIKAYSLDYFIKYVDFMNDKVRLTYLKAEKGYKDIYYKDIDSIELVIDTCIGYNKYGPYSATQGLYINIKSGSYLCSIHHAPLDLGKLYKVVYYSQFMKSFSYKFTGNGEQTKEVLKKVIDDYIQNNYRKTLRTYMYSPVNPIILTIIFVTLFVGFTFFILSLFK